MLNVRFATHHDVAAISLLMQELQQIHTDALPWLFKPPVDFSQNILALLQKENVLLYVATIDEAVAGYMYAEFNEKAENEYCYAYTEMVVQHLGVNAEYRHQGIGSALLARIKQEAIERNIKRVSLNYWAFNNSVAGFYQKHGFELYNSRAWLCD